MRLEDRRPSSSGRRLRLDLAYDGRPFAGFARQPDQTTVQGVLEDALSRVVGHPVDTTCAGRTDRGVHALGQVVHVDVAPTTTRGRQSVEDLSGLTARLNRMLGDAVTVWAVVDVPTDEVDVGGFDARFSATRREYCYRLVERDHDPREIGQQWRVGDALDVEAMNVAAQVLVGEHDFASFCRAAEGRTTTRQIESITVRTHVPWQLVDRREIQVWVRGAAFCHQQVRSVVGSLVEVGRGRRDARWLADALAARDRAAAGPVAPPHGLTLMSVGYGDGFPASPLLG